MHKFIIIIFFEILVRLSVLHMKLKIAQDNIILLLLLLLLLFFPALHDYYAPRCSGGGGGGSQVC